MTRKILSYTLLALLFSNAYAQQNQDSANAAQNVSNNPQQSGAAVNVAEPKTDPSTDPNDERIVLRDESGVPQFDANGKPVYVDEMIDTTVEYDGSDKSNLTHMVPPASQPMDNIEYFDQHAELTREEVDAAINARMMPRPKSESPIRLPDLQPSKGDRVERIIEQKYPLDEDEIERLRNRVNQLERALNDNKPAKTVGRSISMSLQDVNKIPSINVSQGYIANIAFVDQYGNPWPIEGKSVGSTDSFTIIDLQTADNNQIQIRGLRDYGTTNLTVLLKGASAPMSFDLKGARVNDSRLDVIVSGVAPGGQTPQAAAVVAPDADTAYSSLMVDLRNGIVDPTLKQLHTSGPFKAYKSEDDNAMYVLSTYEIIQPQCSAIVHGNAGLRICRLSYVSPSVMYVADGQVSQAKVDIY